jgi:Arc/MetJ family transcription regulator
MRTTIEIDNSLMRQAMQVTGLLTKKAVVEEGLRLLVKVKGQVGVRRLRGKMVFDGGIRQMEKGEQLQ